MVMGTDGTVPRCALLSGIRPHGRHHRLHGGQRRATRCAGCGSRISANGDLPRRSGAAPRGVWAEPDLRPMNARLGPLLALPVSVGRPGPCRRGCQGRQTRGSGPLIRSAILPAASPNAFLFITSPADPALGPDQFRPLWTRAHDPATALSVLKIPNRVFTSKRTPGRLKTRPGALFAPFGRRRRGLLRYAPQGQPSAEKRVPERCSVEFRSLFSFSAGGPYSPGMPRPKTDTIKFLSQDEAGRLFHELGENKRNKAIFLVAYRHGLRASEVGLLRIRTAVSTSI